jgi:hypothetical protein
MGDATTNEEAVWCYVITNMNKTLLVIWSNQNAPIGFTAVNLK